MIFQAGFSPRHYHLQPPATNVCALVHMAFSTWLSFLTLGSGPETSPPENGVMETHRSFPRAHWTEEQR